MPAHSSAALNVLLKYARLYGLEHSRSASQFDSAWTELARRSRPRQARVACFWVPPARSCSWTVFRSNRAPPSAVSLIFLTAPAWPASVSFPALSARSSPIW